MTTLSPTTTDDLRDAIADATRSGIRLAIRGGGSKAPLGHDTPDAAILDMRGYTGIVDYDPSELVLTVRAGTPLAEVQAAVATEQQMLAFEPWDHGPLFGQPAGAATIGGVVAASVAGPRRLSMGSARDHLLGLEAVSGRGESFVAGAKVVKNVTGYDLPKLMAGSWGRLAAMTQVTLKVLPRPRTEATLVAEGLTPAEAHAAMARALASHAELCAAAHLPAGLGGGPALTAFRLQGFEPSVTARAALLPDILRDHCPVRPVDPAEAEALWEVVRTAAPLTGSRPLWRVNVPPSGGCAVVAALDGAGWFFDWAGGLVWLAFDGDPALVRSTAEQAGGHAMLVRAAPDVRARVPAQHPRSPGVMALEERVRRAFDPAGVFETGRFLDFAHAD
jgi:glycolate oxidase FAD binding subunit